MWFPQYSSLSTVLNLKTCELKSDLSHFRQHTVLGQDNCYRPSHSKSENRRHRSHCPIAFVKSSRAHVAVSLIRALVLLPGNDSPQFLAFPSGLFFFFRYFLELKSNPSLHVRSGWRCSRVDFLACFPLLIVQGSTDFLLNCNVSVSFDSS